MGLQWLYPTEMTMPGWEMPIIFYRLFTIHSERFAKGARKMRERRIHSSHVLPKICTAICLREKNESTGIAPREKKQHITSYHNDMLVASTFIRIDNNIFIVYSL